MDKEIMVYVDTMEYYLAIKKNESYVSCRKIGRTGDHHVK
jgi:hypothetical protein